MKKDFNFRHWILVFEENASKQDHFSRDDEYFLSERERMAIYDSIRHFQRGESGEGKYIYQDAKKYVRKCGDDSYLYALRLFIHEENRHAKYLLQFMNKYGIPAEKEYWVDKVFRWLRHHGNLEVSISVLVTAEYIAAVYYKALLRSTRSRWLAEISQRILEDEDIHIRFQSYALNRIQKGRNPFFNFYMRLQHKILLFGTIPVVWFSHHKVLRAGGYTLPTFAMECLLVYARSNAIIKANEKELLRLEQVW